MKLNLGCGDDIRDGYVNVDFRQTHPSVMQVDLSCLPWPFEDDSADEILMLDFLEHFPYARTSVLLLECFRVLKANGVVVIQVPDAVHLGRALAQEDEYLCNACGGQMSMRASCKDCEQSADDISEAAMRRLFGGQDYPGNYHQTAFTQRSLELKAKSAGLTLLRYEETEHQHKNWNFKAVFRKGDIW